MSFVIFALATLALLLVPLLVAGQAGWLSGRAPAGLGVRDGRLKPPAETPLVVVWADRDRSGTGEAAALALRERLIGRGIAVAVHLPPGPIPANAKGIDWADVWNSGPETVAA